MNSHELHIGTQCWSIPKTPWAMKINFSWSALLTPTFDLPLSL